MATKAKAVFSIPSDSPWMRPAEAAVYAHVSEARIRQYINDGMLPVSMLTQRSSAKGREDVLIERCDLDQLLRQLKERKGAAAEVADDQPKRKRVIPSQGKSAFLARMKAASED